MRRADAICLSITGPGPAGPQEAKRQRTGNAVDLGERQGHLIRVSGEIDALQHDQWLVTHQEDRFLPQVRRESDQTDEVVKMI
ncbi:hypothetical protein [Yoonia sediminilitoris]|uniref:hypothetical protein n=1 Tax=Yoonia sediminilitoris TaxID=1286148 RepID=UPI000D35875F|nr:hypothetical protein [Yoonia sediminilitoris]